MRHPVVDDAAPLLALTNLSTVSFHRWPSRSDRPDRPDVLIVDQTHQRRLRRGQAGGPTTRQVLDELDLAAYLQVTGSRGVHVGDRRLATTDGVAASPRASRACWPPAIPAPRSRAARRPEGDGSTSTSPQRWAQTAVAPTRCAPGRCAGGHAHHLGRARRPRPRPDGWSIATVPGRPRPTATPGREWPATPAAGAAGRPARRPARQRRSGRGDEPSAAG